MTSEFILFLVLIALIFIYSKVPVKPTAEIADVPYRNIFPKEKLWNLVMSVDLTQVRAHLQCTHPTLNDSECARALHELRMFLYLYGLNYRVNTGPTLVADKKYVFEMLRFFSHQESFAETALAVCGCSDIHFVSEYSATPSLFARTDMLRERYFGTPPGLSNTLSNMYHNLLTPPPFQIWWECSGVNSPESEEVMYDPHGHTMNPRIRVIS